MDIHGKPRKPVKLGTCTTVDAETGEIREVKRNAMTLLPCSPDVCQECAVDHGPDEAHNRESLYYQMQFQAKHGRVPTWTDAMAHCTPARQRLWRIGLIGMMKHAGLRIPDDLTDPLEEN